MLTQAVQACCKPDEASIFDVDRWCHRNQINAKKNPKNKTTKNPHTKKTHHHKTNAQTIIKYFNSILICDKNR